MPVRNLNQAAEVAGTADSCKKGNTLLQALIKALLQPLSSLK